MRRITRGGKDTIDHAFGQHDDLANCVAGACLAATEHGVVVPTHRLQTHALGAEYDVLATPDENRIAIACEEARAGYWSGSGHSPHWEDNGSSGQQAQAL